MAALRAILIGFFAATLAVLPALIWRWAPSSPWFLPVLGAVCLIVVILLVAPWTSAARYAGLPNLIQHVHAAPGSAAREGWFRRASISFLLTVAGAPVGPEGAASEAAQGLAARTRPGSSRWFEQYRRTDAATSLAAGLSAAFGSPFAAILIPLELGMGGRVLTVVGGALSAFVASDILRSLGGLVSPRGNYATLTGMSFDTLFRQALPVLTSTGLATLVAMSLILFVAQAREVLTQWVARNARLAALVGAAVIVAVLVAYPSGHQLSSQMFGRIFSAKQSTLSASLLLLSLFLGWVAVRSSIGTLGVFWPLMAVGGACGAITADFLDVPRALPVLTGAAAVWGAVMGAPLSAGILAYELSGEMTVLVAALFAGTLARSARSALIGGSMIERELVEIGIELREGRSLEVLKSVRVRQAMMSDYVAVGEHEPVTRLEKFLNGSAYPFLVVVAANGRYVGLLTADVVQRASREEGAQIHSNVPLEQLLEAKDLLYRSGLKVKTVEAEETLAVTVGLFESTPVVPVLGDQQKVLGLLFAHNVRIAYEQEVAKRSLIFRQSPSDGASERIQD